jgi:hypothetical protein
MFMFYSLKPINHLLAFLLFSQIANGEARKWQNPEGTKVIQGEFLSRTSDSVTMKIKGGREMTFPLTKLHAEDIAWLKKNHPTEEEAAAAVVPDKNDAFDTLKFGDDRATVTKKLKESKLLNADLDGTFFGRAGLNGVYRTKEKIGSLHCFLFFDWDEDDKLKEVTLQSIDQKIEDYDGIIKPCWTQMIDQLTELYGKAASSSKIPTPDKIPEGQMQPSHIWKKEIGGSVLLGVSQVGKAYQAVVRFTPNNY